MAFIKWRGRWYSFTVAWPLILLLALIFLSMLVGLF